MSVEAEVLEIQKKLVKMSSPDGTVSDICQNDKKKEYTQHVVVHMYISFFVCGFTYSSNLPATHFILKFNFNIDKIVKFIGGNRTKCHKCVCLQIAV